MNIRIFFSSPGDVKMERETAKRIVDRLQSEIGKNASIQPYFWEHEVMVATKDYQENIPHMDDFDIVVCILWSRLGTPLDPARHPRPGGGGFKSGTEYEFFTAMKAHELKGSPDIFVFRNTTEPRRPSRPKEVREAVDREIDRLDDFFKTYFEDDSFFTRAINIYSTLGEFEEKLTIALRSYIVGRIPVSSSQQQKNRPSYDRQPYLGLASFDYEDAPVFFGRTAETGEIISAFQQQELETHTNPELPPKHFVLILGSSGSGKSSLARAGVLPMLTSPGVIEEANSWRRATFKPADVAGDPIAALTNCLAQANALPELFVDGTSPKELADLIRVQPQGGGLLLRQALTQAGAQALTHEKQRLTDKLDLLISENREEDAKVLHEKIDTLTAPAVRIALLADQLEELFTSDLPPETLSSFIGILVGLANSGRVFVLATLRSDFYPRCLDHPALVDLMQGNGSYALPAPSATDIGQMIRQPASIAGLEFEEKTASGEKLDELLRDAALKDPTALPLLSYTLEQLYEQRTPEGTMTLVAYEKLGGLEGAIGSRAETVFSQLPSSAQAAFDSLCKQLVTLQDGGEPTRRRAFYSTLSRSPEAKTLVDALVNARLLTADQSPNGERIIAVAHEALLRHWPRLVAWVDENRIFLNTRTRVASRLADWLEKKKADEYLIPRGPNLAAAEAVLAANLASLDPLEIEFIGKSAERVRREGQRKLRNARLVTAGAVVLSIIAIAGGLLALSAKRTAQKERNTAIAQEKRAKEATAKAIAGEAQTAYILGVNLLESGKNREGMVSLGQTLTIDPEHPGALARLYSEQLYSLSKAIPARSFHADTTSRQRITGAQKGPRQYVTFISAKKHPTVLDLATLEQVPGPWEQEPDSMAPVIAEDSTYLANVRNDSSVRIWNVEKGTSSKTIQASERFAQLAFTQDGKLFIDAHEDGSVHVIDTATGKEIHSWKQKQPTTWLEISGDRYVVSTSPAELVIYDRETNSESIVEIPEQAEGTTFLSCRCAREGNVAILHLRSADFRDSLLFIDAAAARLLEDARKLEFPTWIWNYVPGNEGKTVAVALHEAAPVLRDVFDSSLDGLFFMGENYASHIALSPDGRLLAAADPHGTVTVFSTETRRPVFYPIRHQDRLEDMIISWDGRFLLTATAKIATIWDLSVGSALTFPMAYTHTVAESAISENGDLRMLLGSTIEKLETESMESAIEVRLPHPEQSRIVSSKLNVCGIYMPDQTIEFFSCKTEPPTQLSRWEPPGGDVNYWAISADGSTFTCTDKAGRIHFVNTSNGQTIRSIVIPELRFRTFQLAPDGSFLVVISNRNDSAHSPARVHIVDVNSGNEQPIQAADLFDPILHISENGKFVAVSGSPVGMAFRPQIFVWDSTDWKREPASIEHTNMINDFSFSPDSSLIALAGADQIARVFHTATFRQAAEPISNNFAPFIGLRFSPDSKQLATIAANKDAASLRVWNWRDATPISTDFRARLAPTTIHFTPDSSKIIGIRLTSLDVQGSTVTIREITPPANLANQILPLTEAITAHRITRDALPTPTDPLPRWESIRTEHPNSWFLADPTKRTVSPGFTIPSAKWMESNAVGSDEMLTAMPAVSIANASISEWEQATLNNLNATLETLDPESDAYQTTAEKAQTLQKRIHNLVSFAERNADHDADVCYHLAQQARRAGNSDRAIEYAQKAVKLDPAHEDSLHILAIIYQDSEKYRDAILIFRKLRELFPEKPIYKLRLALNLRMISENAEAAELLAEITDSPEINAHERALALVILGKADEALPLFKTSAEDQKRRSITSTYSLDSLVHLITAYHRTGNIALAIETCEMLIRAEPRAADAYNVSRLTIDRIYIDSVVAILKETLEKHPELAPRTEQ